MTIRPAPILLSLLAVLAAPAASAQVQEELPLRFNVDPAHSTVSFTVRHLGLSRVRGTFGSISGALMVDPDSVTRSSLTLVARTESLGTGNERRDQDLRANYFEVDEYPVAVFKSTAVRPAGEDLLVEGDLTIRDVTRPVEVEVRRLGTWKDPDSRTGRIGFTGRLVLDRNEFGVNNPGSAAEIEFVIANEVTLDIELEGVRNDPAEISFLESDGPSAGARLYQVFRSEGRAAAERVFEDMTGSEGAAFNTAEREFLLLAIRLLWDGRAEDAATAAEMGLMLHPSSPRLQSSRAEALWRAGRSQEAREILQDVLADDPLNVTALELLRWTAP